MGGHSAWRKRVANGELAKGSGGAILRHHPRNGRKGKDLALNRKGNLGGHGNPKKKKRQQSESRSIGPTTKSVKEGSSMIAQITMISLLMFPAVLGAIFHFWNLSKR